MSKLTAIKEVESKGSERNSFQPPPSSALARTQDSTPPNATTESHTLVAPPAPRRPDVPNPRDVPSSNPSSLTSELQTLNLLERFEPEPRVLNPALVSIHFRAQAVYTQLYNYFEYRFNDIAYTSDSTIAYVPQVAPAADRVAQVAMNAIINKLIIANRSQGLPVNNLPNPVGPPKGYLFPAVSAAVISAIGKCSPIWSGDVFYVPDLNNALVAYNDHAGNAVANSHIFPANAPVDSVVQRFCSAGKIPLRSTDWKIPTGTVHWLPRRVEAQGRVTLSTHESCNPENFDPPNAVLATLCCCTNLANNATRYVIMKSIDRNVVHSLISSSAER